MERAPVLTNLAEVVALTVAGVVLFDGPALLTVGFVVLVRSLRTAAPRLVVRIGDGTGRAVLDLVAVFGVAVLVAGEELASQSGRWLALATAVVAARLLVDVGTRLRRRQRRARVLVAGPSSLTMPLVDVCRAAPEYGIDAGHVDLQGLGADGAVDADAVVVAGDAVDAERLGSLIRTWQGPPLFLLTELPVSGHVEDLWTERVHAVPPPPVHQPAWVVRSWIERSLALGALVVLSPLLAVVALAVRCSGPGPVLFRQERVGMGGRLFTILKFRSMPVEHRESGWNAASRAEPTRIGQFLRDSSLDELPQLLNVLRGEMSLIGPRPEMPHYVADFEQRVAGYRTRHRVPAGVTGWAQAHGLRGDTSLADRVRFDNHYIDDWSVRRDVVALVRTTAQLLPRRFRPQPLQTDTIIDLREGGQDAEHTAEVVELPRSGAGS